MLFWIHSELTIAESFADGAEGRLAQRDLGIGFTSDWQFRTARQAYASLDVPGDIYLDNYPQRAGVGEQRLPKPTWMICFTTILSLSASQLGPGQTVTGR